MARIILGKEYSALENLAKTYNNLDITDLIDRAAQGIFTTIKRKYRQNKKNIIIFAGPGKTGTVALALATLLTQDDYQTTTYLIYHKRHIAKESEKYRSMMIEKGCSLQEVYDKFSIPKLNAQKDLVIDALFGVGLYAPIQSGGFGMLIDWINKSNCDVLSIDIPSGLMSESNFNYAKDKIIKAKFTVSIENPKLSFFFSENSNYIGELSVISLGIDEEAKRKLKSTMFVSTQTTISSLLNENISENKDYPATKLMLIGGHRFNIGNILTSSKAAIYSGAGEVVCQIPYSAVKAMQIYNPQVDILSEKENELYISKISHNDNSTVVFADSIGINQETILSIDEFIKKTNGPIVISGEMTDIFFGRYDMLNNIPRGSIMIMSKENLSKLKISGDNEYDLIERVKILAEKYNVCIVVKMSYNCTVMPSGNIFFNDIKNRDVIKSKSATAIISSVIGSLISQGVSPVSAAIIGSYIVPMSADIACGYKKILNIGIEDVVEKISESMSILMS